MKLTALPVSELVAAFRSTSPTPGGGSASALAGAVGAALLGMVAAMPKNRASTTGDVSQLQAAATRCGALSEALLALVDVDSEAYDAVIAAYRLPKTSDDEKAARKAGIQAAMTKAAETPLETMRHSADALGTALLIARLGNANAASDVVVAIELLLAAGRGARANVEINLESLDDAAYVARVREEVARVDQLCTRVASGFRLRQGFGGPP
jgi:formiminotetrahydrofolate cyclodeaminase